MYKYRDRQINLDDFNQPFGMELDPNNRWVRKSKLIPWDEIERDYASLFPARDGNVAKPGRLGLGALIIQKEYGFSDEETVAMIQENPYFQYFCGMRSYTQEPPFDSSLLVHFRKRFTDKVLKDVNERIIRRSKDSSGVKSEISPEEPDEKPNGGLRASPAEPPKDIQPKGTLILDATCAPSYIKYPTDTDLLEKARVQTEEIIDQLHDPRKGKRPRSYSRVSRKEFVNFSRKRRKTSKEIRRMIFKQLCYLTRNLRIIGTYLQTGSQLPQKAVNKLEVICLVYEQQKQMYENKTHSCLGRIVSLSQPWLRPIVRGKTKFPVEFGAKLDISVMEGFARLESVSFDAYNESGQLCSEIERYRERTGYYPQRILADKIYRNRENIKYCTERGIRLSGPALGRRKAGVEPDRKQDYRDMCDRIEVERVFSLAKRKYGMGTIYTKLKETTLSAIALSILVLNLNKVLLFAFIFAELYFRMIERKFSRLENRSAVQ